MVMSGGNDLLVDARQRHGQMFRFVHHGVTAASKELGAPIWIDMESSRYVDVTLDVFRRIRAQHDNIGVCVQAYLHRTAHDLSDLLHNTTAIRLVKGAYKEPADVALQTKKQVDESYFRLALQLLEAAKTQVIGYPPAFATHDARLIDEIIAHARQMNVTVRMRRSARFCT